MDNKELRAKKEEANAAAVEALIEDPNFGEPDCRKKSSYLAASNKLSLAGYEKSPKSIAALDYRNRSVYKDTGELPPHLQENLTPRSKELFKQQLAGASERKSDPLADEMDKKAGVSPCTKADKKQVYKP